jgi:hypothetical protein
MSRAVGYPTVTSGPRDRCGHLGPSETCPTMADVASGRAPILAGSDDLGGKRPDRAHSGRVRVGPFVRRRTLTTCVGACGAIEDVPDLQRVPLVAGSDDLGGVTSALGPARDLHGHVGPPWMRSSRSGRRSGRAALVARSDDLCVKKRNPSETAGGAVPKWRHWDPKPVWGPLENMMPKSQPMSLKTCMRPSLLDQTIFFGLKNQTESAKGEPKVATLASKPVRACGATRGAPEPQWMSLRTCSPPRWIGRSWG